MDDGMAIFLGVFGILAWLLSGGIFAVSTSAVHEIEALIAVLIGTVAFGAVGMIEASHDLRDKLLASSRQHPAPVAPVFLPRPQ